MSIKKNSSYCFVLPASRARQPNEMRAFTTPVPPREEIPPNHPSRLPRRATAKAATGPSTNTSPSAKASGDHVRWGGETSATTMAPVLRRHLEHKKECESSFADG